MTYRPCVRLRRLNSLKCRIRSGSCAAFQHKCRFARIQRQPPSATSRRATSKARPLLADLEDQTGCAPSTTACRAIRPWPMPWTAPRRLPPSCLGRRRPRLFAGSDRGDVHTAAMFTLIGTIKPNICRSTGRAPAAEQSSFNAASVGRTAPSNAGPGRTYDLTRKPRRCYPTKSESVGTPKELVIWN